MRKAIKPLLFALLALALLLTLEPKSQFAFNSFILKRVGPIRSIERVVALSERPNSAFVPEYAVESKNGKSVITFVTAKGLFTMKYTNVFVQLGEKRDGLVEITDPRLRGDENVVTFKERSR